MYKICTPRGAVNGKAVLFVLVLFCCCLFYFTLGCKMSNQLKFNDIYLSLQIRKSQEEKKDEHGNFIFEVEASNENVDLQDQIVLQNALIESKEEFLKNGVLNLRQHVVDIPVMKVKGATVDIRKVGKLFDGNILDILLLHECHQALKKLSLCFPDAPVRFALFMNIFFAKILSHKILSPCLFFHQF